MFTIPQRSEPSEPLTVLKTGPDHTRLVYRLKHMPVTDLRLTVIELLRQEG